jgi:large subunit ribosomal protein L9
MEVILLQDIANLGHKDDIVNVRKGYGWNYLIPKGYAILATSSAKKVLEENTRQRAHKEEKLKNEAIELAAKLEKVSLTIGAKTSTKGKIFGSVNTIQIAEALKAQGYDVDRRTITINEEPIKEVGSYRATLRLYRDVSVSINFEVVSE